MQSNKKHAKSAIAEIANSEALNTWPSLTGIRGLAALWVFLLHVYLIGGMAGSFWPPIEWLAAMGRMGVDIFFALSAFLLSVPFAEALRTKQATPDIYRYATRRIARIFPAYYFQLFVLLLLQLLGLRFMSGSLEPGDVLAHSVLWINAWPLVPAYLSTWWTLPVEFGFYLLLPWLALCLTDRRWYWLLLGIALSFLYRHTLIGMDLTQQERLTWIDQLPGRLFQFLVGMLAAFFFVKQRFQNRLPNEKNRNRIIVCATIILLALPAMGWLFADKVYLGAATKHPVLAFWYLYASICIAALLMAVASGRNLVDGLLQSFPFQWLGRISYGVYLWHYPVMLFLRFQMGGNSAVREDFLSFFISSLLITITLAFLSWHWLEAPILKRVGSSAAR